MQRKHCMIIVLALCMAALVIQAAPLGAKAIPPDQVEISTPKYAPNLSHFNPRLGWYTYTVSWQGIPAGTVRLNVNRTGADYEITAKARTAETIDYVYKLRYTSKAVVSAKTLMPKRSVSATAENSRKKRTYLEFLPNGEIHSEYTNNDGKPQSIQFDPDNFTLEPFSAAFLALSLDWTIGDKRFFDTFNGKNRYLIELTAVDQTELMINGKVRKAIIISPKVKKLTDTDTKKLRDAKIYISDDDSREILKISSDLLFGSVDTDMVSFTPSGPGTPEPKPVMESGCQPATQRILSAPPKQKPENREIY